MQSSLLGPLEQKIMDIIWHSALPLKPAEVKKKLKGDYAYTTIMTVLSRMVEKKILKRQLAGKAYYYSAAKSKPAFAKNCLCGFFDKLVDSYGDLAISHFVDTVKKDKRSLKLLKEYLKNDHHD